MIYTAVSNPRTKIKEEKSTLPLLTYYTMPGVLGKAFFTKFRFFS